MKPTRPDIFRLPAKRPPDWLVAPHFRTSTVREEQVPFIASSRPKPAPLAAEASAPADDFATDEDWR